jgi:hypothetical protein
MRASDGQILFRRRIARGHREHVADRAFRYPGSATCSSVTMERKRPLSAASAGMGCA